MAKMNNLYTVNTETFEGYKADFMPLHNVPKNNKNKSRVGDITRLKHLDVHSI